MYDDDLELRIIQIKQVPHGCANRFLFVMCGHKDGDRRRQRGSFDPVQRDAFQMLQVRCARLQRDDQHHQVSEIRKEIIVKKYLVRDFQKVNHEQDAAAVEAFSWGSCSGGAVPVRRTSSKTALTCLLVSRMALISASILGCKPAFSSAVKYACNPYRSRMANTRSKIGAISVLRSIRASAARRRTSRFESVNPCKREGIAVPWPTFPRLTIARSRTNQTGSLANSLRTLTASTGSTYDSARAAAALSSGRLSSANCNTSVPSEGVATSPRTRPSTSRTLTPACCRYGNSICGRSAQVWISALC